MTQKSFARKQRDIQMKDARTEGCKQIEGNKIYDDIQEVYQTCGKTLIGYAKSYNELCVDEHIPVMTQEQSSKVKTLVGGFKEDIDTLTKDLLSINKPFVGKTGGEESLDKFIDTIGIVDQYSEFIGRCKGVLDPTFRALAAEISVIDAEYEKQKSMDPNVVTTVEAKEIAK